VNRDDEYAVDNGSTFPAFAGIVLILRALDGQLFSRETYKLGIEIEKFLFLVFCKKIRIYSKVL